ncbi:MAG: NifU family protein [Bacteroidia bacterium]|nr:NifU family protein [Bacteroidia bacterium]
MDEQLKARIELAIDSVRSYLRSDGGDVRIHHISEEGVVELELLGSCESCSMSAMTMKAGLEQVILRAAPEITRVIAINQSH